MFKQGVTGFKYFLGVSSLSQIATRDDRVCVLNILGGESSDVTPVSHEYSGGNVVFGTSPGRRGQVLPTKLGNVPVYNNVREGMDDGHRFNCGVVYLPPSAARDGVAELIRLNQELKKIFIITEKISVHDTREIRAMAQLNGVDIFGANCLGVVDTWNRVRIGGALGGETPEEALRKGSVAIFSNSGGFTTTIAAYLRMAGWGTTTLVSSGKDVYIQYAAPEFAFALANDARSKAAVLYVEPGGYYEEDAHFTKPVIACVVGRWKSKLTRAVGHAGALAGGSDDAQSKERWFMERFGVDGIFTPENPVFSAKGALVTNIAHIPDALTAVMRENATRPDFAPEGSMALKPWFCNDLSLSLPPELQLPTVKAIPPYDRQILQLNQQLGAVFPRQAMKDTSGASQMHAEAQVTSLYGVTMLDAARYPLEAHFCLALLRETGTDNDWSLVSVAVGAATNLFGDPALAAAQAARDEGNAPNSALAAACSIVGPRRALTAQKAMRALIDAFAESGLSDAADQSFDVSGMQIDSAIRNIFTTSHPDPKAEAILAGLEKRNARSVFIRYLKNVDGYLSAEAVVAAICATLAWGPLMRKRISLFSAVNLPWWISIFGVLVGASVDAKQHEEDRFCDMAEDDILGVRSLTEVCYAALLKQMPTAENLFSFQTLVGLLLTNGPGTISAQGAKGAVSADGPEDPKRVQINKAMTGFLTHSGYTHGGNGFEGVSFLIEQFRDSGLVDPSNPDHGIDLMALATRYALEYGQYKTEKKSSGGLDLRKIPGVNHPVFKDKPVNVDPREEYVHAMFKQRGEYNVFHEYYRALVQALYETGVSRNVYCVNIDAVIASVLLKILWQPYRNGTFTDSAIETAAFTIFLYGRMLGCAAEIDDHINRGRNMDTRTSAADCQFVY